MRQVCAVVRASLAHERNREEFSARTRCHTFPRPSANPPFALFASIRLISNGIIG